MKTSTSVAALEILDSRGTSSFVMVFVRGFGGLFVVGYLYRRWSLSKTVSFNVNRENLWGGGIKLVPKRVPSLRPAGAESEIVLNY